MVEWEKLEELWCKVNLGMDMSWRCYVGILIARAHILETASLSENRSQVVSGKSGITAWASTDVILFSYTLTFSPGYCTNSRVRSLTSCTVTSLTLSITTLSCDLGPSHVFSFHCPYSCLKLKTLVFSLPRMHWLKFSTSRRRFLQGFSDWEITVILLLQRRPGGSMYVLLLTDKH